MIFYKNVNFNQNNRYIKISWSSYLPVPYFWRKKISIRIMMANDKIMLLYFSVCYNNLLHVKDFVYFNCVYIMLSMKTANFIQSIINK